MILEGKDDYHAISHLLRRHGIDFGSQLKPFMESAGGEPDVMKVASVAVKSLDRVALVIDADVDAQARWCRYRDALRNLGLNVPDALPTTGLVVPGLRADTTVGLWQMPDNQGPGKIEHLLSTLVPKDDPCWPLAIQAVVDARKAGAPIREIDQIKGQMHTWLAWREDPGIPFGTAIRARVLRADSPIAQSFVDWFRLVFR